MQHWQDVKAMLHGRDTICLVKVMVYQFTGRSLHTQTRYCRHSNGHLFLCGAANLTTSSPLSTDLPPTNLPSPSGSEEWRKQSTGSDCPCLPVKTWRWISMRSKGRADLRHPTPEMVHPMGGDRTRRRRMPRATIPTRQPRRASLIMPSHQAIGTDPTLTISQTRGKAGTISKLLEDPGITTQTRTLVTMSLQKI